MIENGHPHAAMGLWIDMLDKVHRLMGGDIHDPKIARIMAEMEDVCRKMLDVMPSFRLVQETINDDGGIGVDTVLKVESEIRRTIVFRCHPTDGLGGQWADDDRSAHRWKAFFWSVFRDEGERKLTHIIEGYKETDLRGDWAQECGSHF